MTHAGSVHGMRRIALIASTLCGVLLVVPLAALILLGAAAPKVSVPIASASAFATFNSFSLALAVALMGCGLGLVFALSVVRLPATWRKMALIVLGIPILLPSYLLAVAWAPILSPTGMVIAPLGVVPTFNVAAFSACTWIQSCAYYPIAMLIFYVTLVRWNSSFDEVARSAALAPITRLAIKLRWLVRPGVAAFLLIALLSLGDFAVPDFFGIRTAGSEIFSIAASYLDARAALYASLPLILGTMLLLLFLAHNSRRTWRALALAEAGRARQDYRDGGRGAKYLAVFLIASAIGILGVPIVAVLTTLANGSTPWMTVLGQAIASVDRDIIDSVRLASLVATIAAIPSLLGAYASSRAENKLDHLGRGVAVLALVTPIGLWALGASVLTANLPFSVAGSVGVALAIGVGLRTLTPSMEAFAGVFRGVPVSHEEAGRAAGLSNGTIWARVLAPQLVEPMFIAFFVAWVWVLNDVTATVLLAPPGFSTLMLRIFQSVHYGPPEYLAALVLIHVAMILTALAVTLAGSRLLQRVWR